MEFTGDAEKVFDLFDLDGGKTITVEEVDAKAAAAIARGDHDLDLTDSDEPTSPKSPKDASFLDRQVTTNQKRSEKLAQRQRSQMKQREEEAKKADMRASDLKSFRKQLNLKYGGSVRAWVAVSNPRTQTMGQFEFAKMVSAEGFNGDVNKLWAEINPKTKDEKTGEMKQKDVITVEEWAPEAAELLNQFRNHLKAKYGSILQGWLKGIDKARSVVVGKEAFVSAATAMEFGTPELAEKVFYLIDLNGGGTVSLDELSLEAADAIARGDELLSIEEADNTNPADKSFFDRMKTNSARRQEAIGKQIRKDVEDAAAREKAFSRATDLKSFRALMATQYGGLAQAWYALSPLGAKKLG